jgi:excisionase family DNA binding protein
MAEKQPIKSYYTVPEVAKELNLSVITVRRYVNKKIKGFYKMGKEWRIEKEKLEVFLKELKNQAQ